MILVKIQGKKKSRAQIHDYDPETETARCRPWWRPGPEWEVQDKDFTEVPFLFQCLQCKALRRPQPPKPLSAREQRQLEELERLEAWNKDAGWASGQRLARTHQT
jgi:hypothetical protein